MAGISRKSLTDWLTEKRPSSRQGMRKLVDRLGIDQGWLLTGEGEIPRAISGGVVRTDATSLRDSSDPSNRSILTVDANWLKHYVLVRPDEVLLVHASDDELAPKICRGEPVLVRPGVPGPNWRLMAVQIAEGNVIVRYVREEEGVYALRGGGEGGTEAWDLPPESFGKDKITILGEVAWFGTRVNSVRSSSPATPSRAPMRRKP
jgi:hypothetical protein